jgi:hypothetical protein
MLVSVLRLVLVLATLGFLRVVMADLNVARLHVRLMDVAAVP